MTGWKMLGLLIVVTAAIGLVSASTAQAESYFTASEVGATIKATTVEPHVFTTTGSNAECTEVALAGVTEALDAETLRLVPTFKSCTAFGFAATVSNEYCVYILYAGGQLTIEPTTPKISCQIVVSVNNVFAKCKVVLKNQVISKAITYTSTSSPVEPVFNASAFSSEVVESSGLCPLSVGSHSSGTYKGKSRLTSEGATIRWHSSSNRFTASKAGALLVESSLVAHGFSIRSSSFTCKEVSFAGTTSALESSTIVVVPTYKGCTVFGFTVTVVNESCRYVFHATGELEIQPIPPATSCKLQFSTQTPYGNCKFQIPDQEAEILDYSNGASDLVIRYELTGMEAEVTESNGLCPFAAGAANAGYSGESTFKAEGAALGWQP